MRWKTGDLRVSLSPFVCIWLAFLLLMLPLGWIIALILAAVFHECCHGLAIYLTGSGVRSLRIGAGGAELEIPTMTHGRELICALAGPLGGLVLLFFVRWIPRIAVCAVIHSLYNLLPIYPLDGGRALRCLAAMAFPMDRAEVLCLWIERISLCAIWILACYAAFGLKLGLFPILFSAFLTIKAKSGKIPCKRALQGVQ